MYAGGNPISYRDPKGKELVLGAIGAAAGITYGLINGYLSGDRGAELAVDVAASTASGALIGLSNGLSLLDAAITNAGIEAYRQLGNSAISGCQKEDARYIALAGGASIFGDLIGAGSAAVRAELATNQTHAIVGSDAFANFGSFISTNRGGLFNIPISAAQGSTY